MLSRNILFPVLPEQVVSRVIHPVEEEEEAEVLQSVSLLSIFASTGLS